MNSENKMRQTPRKTLCIIFACLLLVPALVFIFGASAANVPSAYRGDTTVQQYQDKITALQAEADKIKAELRAAQGNLSAAQGKANSIATLMRNTEAKIEVTRSLVEELSAQVAAKQLEIDAKNTEIDAKLAEMEETRETFLMLIRAQYENGDASSYLEVIFGAKTLSDLLSRIENVGTMMSYSSTILEKLTNEKNQLEAMRATLETAKAELDESYEKQLAYQDDLEREESELETQKANADKYVSSLGKTVAEIEAEHQKYVKEIQSFDAELEKYLKALIAKNKGEYVGGTLAWPVDTSIKRISSYYGNRTYWYYGKKVSDFHYGIDIPSSANTPIYAAQSGTVIVAASHSSYGNYMIVDHGGGISTLYAHCNKLLKSVGDKVKQGDNIALMGTTGNSTGVHLHFEVRVDGKHTNPLDGWVVQP